MRCGEATPLLLKGTGIFTVLACSALTWLLVVQEYARWDRKDGAVRPAPAPAPFAMRHDTQGLSLCC